MESFLKNRQKIIRGVSLVFVFSALVTGIFGTGLTLIQTSRTISSGGSVKGIGVGIYWDSACANQVSSIDWGLLDPDSSKAVTVYVRNEGNSVVTLFKSTQNWNPSAASSYMTLNWNYNGQPVNANAVVQVKLTLSVLSSVLGITDFSFDIIIAATG